MAQMQFKGDKEFTDEVQKSSNSGTCGPVVHAARPNKGLQRVPKGTSSGFYRLDYKI